jgi:hypothetical protein
MRVFMAVLLVRCNAARGGGKNTTARGGDATRAVGVSQWSGSAGGALPSQHLVAGRSGSARNPVPEGAAAQASADAAELEAGLRTQDGGHETQGLDGWIGGRRREAADATPWRVAGGLHDLRK